MIESSILSILLELNAIKQEWVDSSSKIDKIDDSIKSLTKDKTDIIKKIEAIVNKKGKTTSAQNKNLSSLRDEWVEVSNQISVLLEQLDTYNKERAKLIKKTETYFSKLDASEGAKPKKGSKSSSKKVAIKNQKSEVKKASVEKTTPNKKTPVKKSLGKETDKKETVKNTSKKELDKKSSPKVTTKKKSKKGEEESTNTSQVKLTLDSDSNSETSESDTDSDLSSIESENSDSDSDSSSSDDEQGE